MPQQNSFQPLSKLRFAVTMSSPQRARAGVQRREFIGLIGGAATWTLAANAQQAKRPYRIGYIALSNRVPWIDGMLDGLRELGYVEGRNLEIDWRLAAGKRELIAEMAADLVRLNVDVIVVAGNAVAAVVKQATKTIPIVALATHDGVNAGLYASLAKPGDNITGLESLAPELDVKRVQFLKEIFPKLTRLSVLYNPLDQGARVHPSILTSAARTFGMQTDLFEVRSASEFEAVFVSVLSSRPDALLSVLDPMIIAERQRIVDFCVKQGLPNAHEIREFVQLGGLLSYGASFYGIWHRSAYYIDRTLRGTKTNELPVELPTVFDLAINLKAAKLLNARIPDGLIATADAVIE
jgi:putative tryptophan/tyrosine transport system substrate-binding protein